MKFHLTIVLYLFIILTGTKSQGKSGESFGVIPEPAFSTVKEDSFTVHKRLTLYAPKAFGDELHYFQKELLRHTGISLSVSGTWQSADIIITNKEPENDFLYSLEIEKNRIKISTDTNEGAFYGVVSLLQLIRNAHLAGSEIKIPCGKISDKPTYSWRGIMLDESRHFFGKEKVKLLLDWMAFYKLNRFHWHLTDEPGWRIEILNYPKLGLIGGIGNYTNPFLPAQFYTQEDIKEIVAYAAERKIEIIPEIDMPGHATAANRAYPRFSGGGSEKHPDFTFNPGMDETYQYLFDILKEVDVLFPSQMIHLGGDEVSYGNKMWKQDAGVQNLMKNNLLSDLKAVEDYFMRRMSDSLLTLNNSVLAWDEMATAGLPTDKSIIFWWRHDQPQQLEKSLMNGHQTVICPRIPFYFDFIQHDSHQYGRRWAGNFNPLKKVYGFSLDQLPVKSNQRNLILGFQANLWTETVTREQRLDYLLFPRMAALAEVVWSQKQKKNYQYFLKRIEPHLKLYAEQGIYFYNPINSNKHPEPAPIKH